MRGAREAAGQGKQRERHASGEQSVRQQPEHQQAGGPERSRQHDPRPAHAGPVDPPGHKRPQVDHANPIDHEYAPDARRRRPFSFQVQGQGERHHAHLGYRKRNHARPQQHAEAAPAQQGPQGRAPALRDGGRGGHCGRERAGPQQRGNAGQGQQEQDRPDREDGAETELLHQHCAHGDARELPGEQARDHTGHAAAAMRRRTAADNQCLQAHPRQAVSQADDATRRHEPCQIGRQRTGHESDT
ncbi:Uncharacterised protein [Bordetella pertussis]|nr:Uncharacterised protein [Bordetella pertussis]